MWQKPPAQRSIVIFKPGLVRPVARSLLAVAIILITWIALTPTPPEAATWISWDKANHALAFFVLAGLVQFSVQSKQVIGWVGLGLYGIGIETAQGLMGFRYFEFSDMVANTIGILLFVVISPILFKLELIHSLKYENEVTE